MKIKKLQQFFKNASYKSRVYLYLYAVGYNVMEISRFTKKQLIEEKANLSQLNDDITEIDADFSLILEQAASLDDNDFVMRHNYPDGRKITPKRIVDNFYRAFQYVDEVNSLDDFRNYINK